MQFGKFPLHVFKSTAREHGCNSCSASAAHRCGFTQLWQRTVIFQGRFLLLNDTAVGLHIGIYRQKLERFLALPCEHGVSQSLCNVRTDGTKTI